MLDQAGKNQTLVFVHSRKETAKTARFLRDMAVEKETITRFVKADSATREILEEESNNVKDANHKDLLPFGFTRHHAGMTKKALIISSWIRVKTAHSMRKRSSPCRTV